MGNDDSVSRGGCPQHPSFGGPENSWKIAHPAYFCGRPRARLVVLRPMDFRPLLTRLILAASFGPALFAATPGAADPAPLATAAAVLSLDAERAGSRLPVAVSGVVTAAEPDWNGQFFVQDATGGVFVENLQAASPLPGDVVAIAGVSHPGAFAPIVSEPRWKKTGTAPLPPAKLVSIENLESGAEDGERIEISGIVRSLRIDGSRINVELAVGGYRLQVRAPVAAVESAPALVGARVRVRGTTATHYNAALRHLTAVAVYVPRAGDFTILESEAVDPFDQPVIPLNRLAQYRRESTPGRRIHVSGTVTLQRVGEDVFIQDRSGGIRLVCAHFVPLTPGDRIEAVGFLEYENYLPLVRDAFVRRLDARAARVPPGAPPLSELKTGRHHADLITLRGKILDRSTRPLARDEPAFSGVVTTWLIQGDGLSFTAEHEDRVESATLAAIPLGSVVDIDGVCLSEIDPAGKLKSLKLLLAAPGDLRVVSRPSWLTPERLLIGVALLSALLIVVAIWSLTVSKKNTALRDTLRELEQAQRDLQEAHDTLEQKVIERSNQLQVEMSARKTAELQFKAVLAERTRLARDLHDSLEQTLTGIALQLDTTAKLFQRSPEASSHHLSLARTWLQQSQIELRRSIWDLRSRELEQFDLASALRRSAEHLVDGTDVVLEFTASGTKGPLPEIIEENILRIGQEALTNIAKYAHASRIVIALDHDPAMLSLRVEDDGVGFDPAAATSDGGHHFGLIGMMERAKRLAGGLTVESAFGRGTKIIVEIPLAAPPQATAAAVTEPPISVS